MFQKLFLAYFCNFWCTIWFHLAQTFLPTWSQCAKKNPRHYFLVFRNVSRRQLPNIGWNQQKFLKMCCLEFQCPQIQSDHPEIDQSCFTECWILYCCLFPFRCHVRGRGACFFYCLESKAGINSCIFTTTTLEVIEGWSYLCLFSFLVTIPVQQYRSQNVVGYVGAALLTCLKVARIKGFNWEISQISKGDVKNGIKYKKGLDPSDHYA